MAKTDFKNADEYLATFPPETRKILEEVRKVIRDAVPGAEEVISYQIPAFKLDGGWIFYYSGYKAHYSLACPPPFAAFKAFAKELSGYKSSKSAVQFPYNQRRRSLRKRRSLPRKSRRRSSGSPRPNLSGARRPGAVRLARQPLCTKH
jgi:uncharacterized protein YdhG (YjbR/CyaY superfamily)